MTVVYHGSLSVVDNPEIRESNRSLDYGSGFYTTTSYEQAVNWVKNKLRHAPAGKGYVNVYHFDEQRAKSMKRLSFRKASLRWVNFVVKNRMVKGFTHDYDIVYGPVADDRTNTQFLLYQDGAIDKETLIKKLLTFRLADQYLFHTPQALSVLTFIEAKEIKL